MMLIYATRPSRPLVVCSDTFHSAETLFPGLSNNVDTAIAIHKS